MIRKQPFGNTGHMSTSTIFGAASLSRVTQEEADRVLDLLLDYGVARAGRYWTGADAS